MKTLLPLLAATLLALAGCGQKAADDTHLSVAATAVPHAEILNVVKPMLASEGITLDIKVFADYVQPNQQVAQKQIDVNYFQTEPYLDQFNRERGTHLVTVVGVHIEPFGLYSSSIPDVDSIPEYAEVALPSDPVNVDRSLMMLDRIGLIECAPARRSLATVGDVRSNPRRLLFKELASWLLGGVREDFDVVFLFGNQAMEWGVDTGSSLYCDRGNPAYAEYLVARADNRESFGVRALTEVLNAEATRDFITNTYAGQVLAAF